MEENIKEKINKIIHIIVEKTDPARIILFGSRAKRTAHYGSDIDIALEGVHELSVRDYRLLKEEIDKVSGLYSVDIVFIDKVDNSFKRIIQDTGVILYEKK
jgi:predicted nucleotidyltransferase